MVKTRSLTADEVRGHRIFPSSYRSQRRLKITSAGTPPELTWRMRIHQLARPVVRRLEGDTLEVLAELYGPAENLRFIGAYDADPGGDEKSDGTLVGLLTWRYDSWNETVWLCDIRVEPEVQRTGIGGRLMEDLMWASLRLDARGVMLETQDTNLDAITFYTRHGFRLSGFNDSMYGEPGDDVDAALYYWKSLEATPGL